MGEDVVFNPVDDSFTFKEPSQDPILVDDKGESKWADVVYNVIYDSAFIKEPLMRPFIYDYLVDRNYFFF